MIMPIGHTLKINKIIELNNSDFLVSCSDDFTCKIWDKRTGKLIKNLKDHSDRITSLEYNRFNNEIITGAIDSLICFYKIVKNGITITKIKASEAVNFFSLDSINQVLYVLEGNNKISSWDMKKHKRINQFIYNNCDFSSLKYSYDNKSLVILSWNGNVYVNKNPNNKELLVNNLHNSYVNNIIFGYNQLIYTSSWDGDIIKWKQSDSFIKKYSLSNQIINEFKLINHDSIVLAASFDNKLAIYNLVNDNIIKKIDFENWVMGVSINEFQNTAAIISKDGIIKLLDLKSFTIIKSKKLNQNLETCQYINSSKDILCTFSNGTALVMGANSLNIKFELSNKNITPVNSIFNSDGSIIFANASDKSYSIWDIKNGVFFNKKTHTKCIIDIDHPNTNGEILLNFGNTLKLFNRNANYYINQKTFDNNEIIKSGFSRIGKTPYVILRDSGLFILDQNSLNPIEKYFKLDYAYFINVEFTSDDSRIIIGDTEGNISIYDRPNKEAKLINIDEDDGEIIYINEFQTNKICVISRNKIALVDLTSNTILKSLKINPMISDAKVDNNKLYLSHYNGFIQIFNLNSLEVEKKINSEYSCVEINTTEKLLIITTLDGQIHCKNKINFETECILYGLNEGNYIIKLSKSPYYMCSKEASKMLHYITPSIKVIGFDQLDPIYNRPDIVLETIGNFFGGYNDLLISQYRSAWEKRIVRLGLNKDKLGKGEFNIPNAEIENADVIAYENKEGKITLNLKANDISHSLIRYNILVNEVPIYCSQGISIGSLNSRIWDTTVTVPLSIGENKIQVSVMNELGLENFKYPTYVNYVPKSNEITAKTFYIGIGVDNFNQETNNQKETQLDYCVKDVNDLAKLFGEDSNTIVKIYTNEQVNKENILSIKNFLKENTTENDRVIISCSSHGLLDNKNNFYLAMHDIDFDNPSDRGLAYEELENLLDGIPARKKLLLLDACNSGENELIDDKIQPTLYSNKNNVASLVTARGEVKVEKSENNSFNKMNELFFNTRNKTGSIIISAAGGRQSALEGTAVLINNKAIENGAFTFAVLEYLKKNKSNVEKLTVNQLKKYVEERVVEITNGRQEPTSRQETIDIDWNLN